ncbi:RHS repeat-associated core domain-containing protein [Pseudomonas sp. RP23018S]|uniref:RHS repeat domain-containing protein n=1 Tax=Pseudomonas sp. RP23018S TaxID=3096037 RepID=UPI002ACAA396|nr:RHS repeat-associated core domain-containing protein [Pseudomonas sp. RP23018S]MDZ5603442.1 RHS repeat-associated core domain-containing protein [Pseudomonas sp. RP23018S]
MKPVTPPRFADIGLQRFDGLGRQSSVTVGGRTTGYHYVAGQLPPSANTLANGQRVEFSYIAALDNPVEHIQPSGEQDNRFTYERSLAMIRTCEGPLGLQTMTYSAAGRPKTDTWRVDGTEYMTTWQHSLGGQLLGYEDADKVLHQRTFDPFGRLCKIEVGDIRCTLTYDEFSRPSTYTTLDTASGRQLVQTLSYDAMGRERTRDFVAIVNGQTRTHVQTLTYTALDQVHTRHWQDDTRQGQECFTYDLLGRLLTCTADPAIAPLDPFGNAVIAQHFSFNALDGQETVLSTYADGSQDLATYRYDNPDDPCQVSRIEHTHASWPALISLEYDDCGRLVRDSLGRQLSWDGQDRVTRVEYRGQVCDYGYDPSGNLCDRTVDNQRTRSFFSAGQLTHEQCGVATLRPIGAGGQLLALERLTAGVRQGNATLLGCDAQGSVRLEVEQAARTRRYTAHGAAFDTSSDDNPFGFAGERREPLTGWYIPAGYRPYDPLLMMFLAPDSQSPFGRGGINPYAYCAGDPINRIDPDGHSWLTWVVAGVGLALGAVATVATFGAAAPAFAAVMAGGISAVTASGAMAMGAATLGAISLGTGVASTVLEALDKDSKAASILGWVSLGTGLLGTGLEMAPKAASATAKLTRKAGKALRSTRARGKPTQLAGGGGGSVDLPPPTSSQPPQSVVGFYGNFDGQKSGAFITHGDSFGYLMDTRGMMGPPEIIAQQLIAPSIAAFAQAGKLDVNRPLVLIACNAADSGAAQRVSNFLGMKVKSPLGEVRVPRFKDMQTKMLTGEGLDTILSKRSTLPANLRRDLPDQEYVPVLWRMFSPQHPA